MAYLKISSNGTKTEAAHVDKPANRFIVASSASNRKVGDCVEKVIRNQFIVILQHDRAGSSTIKCAMTVPTSANLQISGATAQEKREAWEELKRQVDCAFNDQTFVIEGIPPKVDYLP